MKKTFKQDKGQAGLTILLSVIITLFIIGLLIAIFSIMGSELQISSYDTTTSSVVNESITPKTSGTNLAKSTFRDVVCGTATCRNFTGAPSGLSLAGNFTQTNCLIANTTSTFPNAWKCSYSYTWSADNTATDVMNETIVSVSSTTDWFDIFIVITAMVVLILLTVIIITAIRSSGMIGGQQGANTVGTA